MTILTRLGATALTAALISVPTVAVTSADAAPTTSWTTIARWEGAKLQACRVPIRDGKAFKIYGRLVNGKKARIGGALMVSRGAKTTSQWRSPLVARGKTSKVGSVVFVRKPGYSLGAGVFQAQMGDGGSVKVSRIGRC